jgi:hypothetical protein
MTAEITVRSDVAEWRHRSLYFVTSKKSRMGGTLDSLFRVKLAASAWQRERQGYRTVKMEGARNGQWSHRVMGAMVCLMGIATAGLAAEKTDLGPQPAPDRNWQVGFSPSYSSGNFGTDTTSTFLYAPISVRRFFRDGDVAVVLPFVTATTDGRTTIVGGNPVVVDGDNSGPGGGGSGGDGCSGSNSGPGGGSNTCGTTSRLAGQKVTTAGIGDIILRGRYYVLQERDYLPLIAITGRLKIPTASASQGLGTGKMDEGVGAEMSKLLGEKWLMFLDGGFNVIGRPDGLNLRNQWWYDMGAGYYWTKNLLTTVYFEEYRSLVSGRQNIRDFYFGANYRASDAWRYNAGVTVGVSNGAPDYAFMLGTSYRF